MNTLLKMGSLKLGWIFILVLAWMPGSTRAEMPWQVTTVDEMAITESSGLGVGNRGVLWTHNDSGAGPELFAVDKVGHCVMRLKVTNASAIDWEDLALYDSNGQRWILAADCGDNQSKRASIQIYRINEPPAGSPKPARQGTAAEPYETVGDIINIRFDDGPHDCEAVAVDISGDQIVLIAKTKFPWCGVYVVPLSELEKGFDNPVPTLPIKPIKIDCVATRVGNLPLPMVTAMDIHPLTGEILVCSYFQVFVYPGLKQASLMDRLSGKPIAIELPKLKQIEGACFDFQGNLWISSEGQPMKFATLNRADWSAE